MRHIALAVALFSTAVLAGPKEFNAAMDAARKTHADTVNECKTLPVKVDLEACINRADQTLAAAGKAARAKHLPKVAP